jgi:hypothetical protein
MPLPSLIEVKLFLVLTAMFFLPGSALLVISRSWAGWQGLQRYVLAVGLSIAFYPVLFYSTRFLLPQATITAVFLTAILVLAALITVWGWWRFRVFPLKFDGLEWVFIFITGLAFVSRFWIALTHPYPAWSDSLHHTLLTELTAVNGRLPRTLEPYFPNGLNMYHLGLYALSGSVQMLAQIPAHTALLWTAQFLNSLCGVGVYLVLDRYSGRLGAVVGTAVVTLFSVHPALWVNWGRFTQLSSLSILLIAWVLNLEIIRPAPTEQESPSHRTWWLILFSALCTVALFLFHFRAAIFYLPLVGISILYALFKVHPKQQRLTILKRLAFLGIIAILLVLPALWPATSQYLATRQPAASISPEQVQQVRQSLYVFPLSAVPYLVAPNWLLLLTSVSVLIGLVRRNRLVVTAVIWTILLIIMGNLYLLNVPVLNFTNLGAVLIMLYLPIGLVVGAVVTEMHRLVSIQYRKKAELALVILILIATFPAAYRRATLLEPYRHFITATDITAMNWINENLPEDAIFAINTYFWLPNFAHGTDAGYWIPYFTDRHIVTSSMHSSAAPPAYRQRILTLSQTSESLETDLTSLETLYNLGVEYLYIGAKGDFSGSGLQYEFLTQSNWVEPVYQNGDTIILHIRPPAS